MGPVGCLRCQGEGWGIRMHNCNHINIFSNTVMYDITFLNSVTVLQLCCYVHAHLHYSRLISLHVLQGGKWQRRDMDITLIFIAEKDKNMMAI